MIFFNLLQAIEWVKDKTPAQIIAKREAVLSQLELADYKLRRSGVSDSWFAQSSAENQRVTGGANGHLFEQLLSVKAYSDVGAAHLLRDGEVFW